MEEAALAHVAGLDLVTVFGQDAFSGLPEATQAVVADRWAVLARNLEDERSAFERELVSKDTKVFQLENDLSALQQKLDFVAAEKGNATAEAQGTAEKCFELRQKVTSLESTVNSLSVENVSLKRDREQLSTERNDLYDLAERRQAEIDRVHVEYQTLSRQLSEANSARCEAVVRVEEILSKEMSLNHKEKRMEEDMECLRSQLSSATSELLKKNEEVYAVRREQTVRLMELQAQLAEKTEELKIAEGKRDILDEEKAVYQSQVATLSERLREARDAQLGMEERYRQELNAQTKLAELYKGQSDESREEMDEYTRAITELQHKLKQAAEHYGSLEAKYDQDKARLEEDLKRHSTAIVAMKNELREANDLIQVLRSKATEEMIESLSPAAATVSKLMKKGMSLTQIYTDFVKCQEELIGTRLEKEKLEATLAQIAEEVEEKAHQWKEDKDAFERAQDEISNLMQVNHDARQDREWQRREADDARARLTSALRENQKLHQDVKDRNMQVCALLREVEAVRAGLGSSRASRVASHGEGALDADSVISDRLVVFHDLAEMQQKNAELLSVVRELSASQEAAVEQKMEEVATDMKKENEELRHKLEMNGLQVQELVSARRRQEAMFESLLVDRDLYKSMALAGGREAESQPTATSTPAVAAEAASRRKSGTMSYLELEKQYVAVDAALKEIKEEFEFYRREKCENAKLINEQLDNAKKELSDERTKTIKLASMEEFNAERIKTAQATIASLRNQITLLEQRNAQLSSISARHEQTVETITKEIYSEQSKRSHVEVQLEMIRNERDVLRLAEARLKSEVEVLHRQRNGSALVLENLNQIKLNMERAEDEKGMRLQNRNDAMEKEIALLRKKIDSEEENFRESLKAWENRQRELETMLEEHNKSKLEEEAKKTELSAEAEKLREALSTAQDALQRSGHAPATRQDSLSAENSAKVRDLQAQLTQSRNEVAGLREMLENAKRAQASYHEAAEQAEKRLSESSSAAKALKEDLENRLKHAVEEQSKAEAVVKELSQNRNLNAEAELRSSLEAASARLHETEVELQAARHMVQNVNNELERQRALAEEAQRRYAQELKEHSTDMETLKTARASLASHAAIANELREAKDTAERILGEEKARGSAVEQRLGKEYTLLQEQCNLLERENASLHQQLSTVTQQLTALHKHVETGDASEANQSFTEEECKSTEQLMQIIKYLRKEKEILSGKVEVVQAESTRVRAQMEHTQRQLDETQTALRMEREGSQTAAMSSARYDELVQKVQTVSALSDSNRMLREHNERQATELSTVKARLEVTSVEVGPLQDRIRQLEDREATLAVEVEALTRASATWKARADELVEKQQKINPEELKRLQVENVDFQRKLTEREAQATAFNSKLQTLMQTLNNFKESDSNKDRQLKIEQAKQAELNSKLTMQTARANQLEAHNKQVAAERDGARKDRGAMDERIKELEASLAKKEEELQAKAPSEEIAQMKATIQKLKNVGRIYRDKAEKLEKEELPNLQEAHKNKEEEVARLRAQVSTLDHEKAKLEGELSAARSSDAGETRSPDPDLETKLAEAEELLAQTAEKLEELEKEKAAFSEKETRYRGALASAKEKILSAEKESERLRALVAQPENQSSDGARLKELEQKVQTLTVERDAKAEEVRQLRQQVEELQHSEVRQHPATEKSSLEMMTASVKPMSGGASTSASTPTPTPASTQRKAAAAVAVQPQVHVQPTRHVPATATIRPHTRTTSVQPTIASVSPNSASTGHLNPGAAEFVPRSSVSSASSASEAAPESSDDRARGPAAVSVSAVSHESEAEAGPSTSAAAMTPARGSTGHTTKRQLNEDAACDSDSAVGKKARLAETQRGKQRLSQPSASSTTQEDEDVAIELDSSDDDDEDEEENVPAVVTVESEDNEALEEEEQPEEEEMMGDDRDDAGDEQREDMPYVMGPEDDMDDVGRLDDSEVDEDNLPYGTEPEDQREAVPDSEADIEILSTASDDMDDANQDEDDEPRVPEQADEEIGTQDSNLPTSSSSLLDLVAPQRFASEGEVGESARPETSSTAHYGRQQHYVSSASMGGQFEDAGESDSVVPSTPKLPTRGHFGETSSSPRHVPATTSTGPTGTMTSTMAASMADSRFLFSTSMPDVAVSSSSTMAAARGLGSQQLDQTAVDFTQFGGASASAVDETNLAGVAQTSEQASGYEQVLDEGVASPLYGGEQDELSNPQSGTVGGVSTSEESRIQPGDIFEEGEIVESSQEGAGDVMQHPTSSNFTSGSNTVTTAVRSDASVGEAVTSSAGQAHVRSLLGAESSLGGRGGASRGRGGLLRGHGHAAGVRGTSPGASESSGGGSSRGRTGRTPITWDDARSAPGAASASAASGSASSGAPRGSPGAAAGLFAAALRPRGRGTPDLARGVMKAKRSKPPFGRGGPGGPGQGGPPGML